MGGFYIAEFGLILLALVSLYQKQRRVLGFLLAWALVAPIPTMLVSSAHALRSTLMLPPLVILSAVGAGYLWEISKNNLKYKILGVIVVLVIIIQFLIFAERLYFISPNKFGKFWSVSAKLASEEVLRNKNNFKYILLSDRIDSMEIAYPVYAKVDPDLVIAQNRQRNILGGVKFKKLNNTYIGYIAPSEVERFLEKLPGSALYISPFEDSLFFQGYNTVFGSNGQPLLVEVSKN